MKVSYGWSVADENDYLLTIIEEGIRIGAQALRPGRWLVDSIPQCELFSYCITFTIVLTNKTQ